MIISNSPKRSNLKTSLPIIECNLPILTYMRFPRDKIVPSFYFFTIQDRANIGLQLFVREIIQKIINNNIKTLCSAYAQL